MTREQLVNWLPRHHKALDLPMTDNSGIFCGSQCPYCKANESNGHQWRVWSRLLGRSVCRYCMKDATW